MELTGLDKINKITNHWFLTEPLYFSVFCTHKLVSNEELSIPIRTGNHEIQFSNKLISFIDYVDLEELLKVEILRILLKHPYQRQPLFAKKELLTYASNYTINDVCYLRNILPGTDIWRFPKYLCFEEYYALLENQLKDNKSENSSDNTEDVSKQNLENSSQNDVKENQNNKAEDRNSENKLTNNDYEKKNTEDDNKHENTDLNDRNINDEETSETKEKELSDEENNESTTKDESDDNSSSNENQDSNPANQAENRNENNRGFSNETNCESGNTALTDYSENAKNIQESDSQNENSFQYKPTTQEIQNRIEQSELWAEDSEFEEQINAIIDFAESSDTWGSISGNLKEVILASKRIKVDYRKMLSFYRTSILSSKRYLTRMKPSRRYDFMAMGSKYALKANLLVAVDVSGSVESASLSKFFSIINRFFKYGVEKIDVLQFDAIIVGDIISIKKAKKEVSVTGRGGTSFQPAIDYCRNHPEYDGLIYFTDGYAPFPDLTGFTREILWIIDGSEGYNYFTTTYGKKKKNRVTYIPSAE